MDDVGVVQIFEHLYFIHFCFAFGITAQFVPGDYLDGELVPAVVCGFVNFAEDTMAALCEELVLVDAALVRAASCDDLAGHGYVSRHRGSVYLERDRAASDLTRERINIVHRGLHAMNASEAGYVWFTRIIRETLLTARFERTRSLTESGFYFWVEITLDLFLFLLSPITIARLLHVDINSVLKLASLLLETGSLLLNRVVYLPS